jgi:hypothetical protein
MDRKGHGCRHRIPLLAVLDGVDAPPMGRRNGKIGVPTKIYQCPAMRIFAKKGKSLLDFGRRNDIMT